MKGLNYFKRELNNILNRQLEALEKKTVTKSFSELVDIICKSSNRSHLVAKRVQAKNEKTGKVYMKTVYVNPDKVNGLKKYTIKQNMSSEEKRNLAIAITKLKKAIDKCESEEQLLKLVLRNKGRFSDENGRPLQIVEELRDYVVEHQKKLANNPKSNLSKLEKKMTIKGYCEWGTVYEMQKNTTSLEAAKFLLGKQDGFVENAFTGVNKNKKQFKVGLCWGHSGLGLKKIIEKHIIRLSDFETLEDVCNAISNVLTNGRVEKERDNKIIMVNGKYRMIIAKESNQFVISAFDKTKDETEKERSEEDKEKKRKELNVVVPNSFTQEGTQLPATASINNIYSKVGSVNNIDVHKSFDSDYCRALGVVHTGFNY